MLHEWLVEHRNQEADYWWFVNKRRIVRQLLDRFGSHPGNLLEVGCGGGYFASLLANEGWYVVASDLSPHGARFAYQHGVHGALAHDAGQSWPFSDEAFDVVIMLDVLEHVEYEEIALMEMRRVLRPGGLAIVSVPAYQWLFSAWDEYNRHFRRYTTGRLVASARNAEFQILHQQYWNAISLPPAVVLRLKDRFRKVSLTGVEYPPVAPWLNQLLIGYGKAEATWSRHLPVPFGLSAIAALRKHDGAEKNDLETQ